MYCDSQVLEINIKKYFYIISFKTEKFNKRGTLVVIPASE